MQGDAASLQFMRNWIPNDPTLVAEILRISV